MTQPNIILITIDCWRFDRLSKRTPNLAALAEQGLSFLQAYTNGGWTQAAFPALLSSTYASMYDGCLGPLAEQRPYLPQLLQQHGYQTLAVQTSPLLSQTYGYDRGLDKLISLDPPWQAPSWYRLRGMQRLLRRSTFHKLASAVNIRSRPAPAYANAGAATDQALNLLQQANKPFFLWIHYMDAHWPYYDQEGQNGSAALAQSWTDRQLGYLAMRRKDSRRPSAATIDRWVSMYDKALESIDSEIGRLLDAVNQQHFNDIFIMATADHGEEFYEHGNFGHSAGNLHEEIVHIPLIMVNRNQFEPATIGRPVSLLDVPPTLIEMLGFEGPASMMGTSLLPLLAPDKGDRADQQPIISECDWGDGAHVLAMRLDDYKFIIDLRQPDKWKLYNLKKDPLEKHNLNTGESVNAPDFKSLLDRHLAAIRASKIAKTASAPTDDRLAERLRELGYLD